MTNPLSRSRPSTRCSGLNHCPTDHPDPKYCLKTYLILTGRYPILTDCLILTGRCPNRWYPAMRNFLRLTCWIGPVRPRLLLSAGQPSLLMFSYAVLVCEFMLSYTHKLNKFTPLKDFGLSSDYRHK